MPLAKNKKNQRECKICKKKFYILHQAQKCCSRRCSNILKHNQGVFSIKGAKKNKTTTWTFNKILSEAKKYKTKKDWRKYSKKSYLAATRNKIVDRVSSHMEALGTHHKRCIYTIKVLNKKIIYIGLTYNFNRRIKNHLETSRFKNLIKKFGKAAIKAEKITGYIDVKEAQKLEQKLIKKFRSLKYEVLNIVKGGGLGGNTVYWTKEKVLEEFKKIKSVEEWREKYKGSYQAAYKFNLYKKLSSNLLRKKREASLWTNKKSVLADALKYNTKSLWKKNSITAVRYARKNGFYDEATKHMKNAIWGRWNKENVIEIGRKYKTRSEWDKKSHQSYIYALKNNLVDQVMPRKNNLIWNKKTILDIAKKYKTISEWRSHDPNSYKASVRYGYHKEATKHLIYKINLKKF